MTRGRGKRPEIWNSNTAGRKRSRAMRPWKRDSPGTSKLRRNVVWLALVGLAAAAMTNTPVTAMPCPNNAVFVYSHEHDRDVCACAPRLTCKGPSCLEGSSANREKNSFVEGIHGFPWECADCMCLASEDETQADRKADEREKQRREFGLKPRKRHLLTGEEFVDYPDRHFDEICHVASNSTHKPQALRNISWIHFPKCGTSFVNVMYNSVCQTTDHSITLEDSQSDDANEYFNMTCEFCYRRCLSHTLDCLGFLGRQHDGLIGHNKKQWIGQSRGHFGMRASGHDDSFVTRMCAAELMGHTIGHTPLKSKQINAEQVFAAMFRNPLSRIRSAYNYGRHAFGMKDQPEMRRKTREWSLKRWAQLPGISSCQVKMLNGKYCAHEIPVNKSHLEIAKEHVDNHFVFVGLVEAWNTSVCLFHRMFGGRVHNAELENLRPTKETSAIRQATREDLQKLSIDDDPYDYALYLHVRTKFIRLLEEYGLEVPEHVRNPPDIYH